MARKKSLIIISNWKGITTVRSKPARTKQTANTREAGLLFGMAANRAKVFRGLFDPILPDPKNRMVINRLQKAFYKWLKTGVLQDTNPETQIFFFEELSFNETIELKQRIKVNFATERSPSGGILFTAPAFDPVLQVKAPAATQKLQFQLATANVEINNTAVQEFFTTSWTVDYIPGMVPAKQMEMAAKTSIGNLILVVIALRYITGNDKMVETLSWKPAGIVGSFFN